MTMRDHTKAWKRLRRSFSGRPLASPARSLRARLSRAFARWTMRDDIAKMRREITRMDYETDRLLAELDQWRQRARTAEATLAAERYARAAFLNTMQWPPGRRPQG